MLPSTVFWDLIWAALMICIVVVGNAVIEEKGLGTSLVVFPINLISGATSGYFTLSALARALDSVL